VDYFSESKPSLFIFLEDYDCKVADIKKMEEDYNLFYSECVKANIHKSL
jgi:hypothetical protein